MADDRQPIVEAPADAGRLRVPPLVELERITKRFAIKIGLATRIADLRRFGVEASKRPRHEIRAVDAVDLAIAEREVVALVGESGCGKTTLGRIAAGLLQPSSGETRWRGAPFITMTAMAPNDRRLKAQMIFQDAQAALNPRMNILDIVGEAPVVHGIIAPRQQVEYVGLQLNRVGLDPTLMRRFPHQFSGGQRARIGVARALAVKPEFLVCDEPLAALDVSIQAQVLNLFMDLQSALSLTYLFISHDLGVVRHISDRVVIMYLGRIVESGPAEPMFEAPNHPYTRALLRDGARLHLEKRAYVPIRGEIPSPSSPPSGCHFHPRCAYAMARCQVETPALREISPGRLSACHLNDAQSS